METKQKEVQKQLGEERERCKILEEDKESLETTLRKQTTDLRKAERQRREAQDAVKQLKEGAESDAKRIGELEKRMRDADRSAMARPSTRRGEGDGEIGQREEATRRWEAEKRLEAKVERLTGKLKEHRREYEAMEAQHASEKERMVKDADKLRLRCEQLEDDKKQLKARLRGAGAPVDSDEVLLFLPSVRFFLDVRRAVGQIPHRLRRVMLTREMRAGVGTGARSRAAGAGAPAAQRTSGARAQCRPPQQG